METSAMKKPREIRYYKPNIGALKGKVGYSILETIMNAHKPDHSELEKECKEVEARIEAAMKDGTY